jgi:hypothetical protein
MVLVEKNSLLIKTSTFPFEKEAIDLIMASYSQDGYNSRVEELRETEYPLLKGLCIIIIVDLTILTQQ